MSVEPSQTAADGLDGVQLAVLTNRMQAVVRSMRNTLARTGRSGVLNTAQDFSCCILTADNKLLATAESLPIHVMSGPDLMAQVMKDFHPTLRAGDAYFHNSPYHGNSHAADHSMLVPVVDATGVHRFTVFGKAHQADCGNAAPTTYSAHATNVYEEGALIFPCVRAQKDYADVDDFVRTCRLRIRVPDQWWGDYLALLGAVRIGERRLLELGAEVGWATLEQYAKDWFDYSERRMDAAIRQLPEGIASVTTAHDPFPGVPDGVPVNVTVSAHPNAGRLKVDLRDNLDCQPCGLNLTESTARTAAMIGVFNSLDHTVPPNAGSFRRLEIQLRENCVVGIPRHPASCSVATTNVADRVANAVQRAFAQLDEGIGLAEAGLSQSPAWGVVSGNDPRAEGAPFVNQLILPAVTGGPASPSCDGWLTTGHVGPAGVMLRDSVEVDEIHHPIRITAQRVLADTEGAGRHRGSPGAYVEYGPVDCEIEVMYVSDGTVNPALGVRGGLAGALADQFKRTVDGALQPLEPCDRVRLRPGERIVATTCGGGGYGLPSERDPELVRADVQDGWVSRERALAVYGVVFDFNGAIDLDETTRVRGGMARTQPGAAE